MFEIAKQNARKRRINTAAVAIGFAGLALTVFAVVPRTMIEVPASESLTAFLASELYLYGWVLGLGGYFAYTGGSLLADDVEHDRMELLLSAPISRSAVVRERFLALLIEIVQVNIVVCGIVYLGILVVGSGLQPMNLLTTHALSIPYLLVCGAIGLLFSAATATRRRASWASVAVVFGLFVLEQSFVRASAIAPTHYYDPAPILTANTYAVTDSAVLLGAAVVISSVARLWFRSTDLRV